MFVMLKLENIGETEECQVFLCDKLSRQGVRENISINVCVVFPYEKDIGHVINLKLFAYISLQLEFFINFFEVTLLDVDLQSPHEQHICILR
jgi:hypothetical protein